MAGVCTNVRMGVYQRAAATNAPAPNQYHAGSSSIGRQTRSRKPTAPRYSFGTSKRAGKTRGSGPAPNAYNAAVSAFGKQRGLSKKPSAGVCARACSAL